MKHSAINALSCQWGTGLLRAKNKQLYTS